MKKKQKKMRRIRQGKWLQRAGMELTSFLLDEVSKQPLTFDIKVKQGE